jgi:hypothetical protein
MALFHPIAIQKGGKEEMALDSLGKGRPQIVVMVLLLFFFFVVDAALVNAAVS